MHLGSMKAAKIGVALATAGAVPAEPGTTVDPIIGEEEKPVLASHAASVSGTRARTIERSMGRNLPPTYDTPCRR